MRKVPDDFVAGTGTGGAVEVGGSATGDIELAGDQDWFAVDLTSGVSYRIDLKGEGTEDRTLPDPYLSGVYDADGNRFTGTADDDGGEGRNSRVFFTATETATYYVSADAFGIDTGTYKLSVNQVAVAVGDAFGTGTDVAADTDTTGAVDVGYSVRGRVNFAGDRDWFAVTLEAGKTYQIDLKGLGTGDGTLLNPYLHWVHDADGNRFPSRRTRTAARAATAGCSSRRRRTAPTMWRPAPGD